MFSIMTVFAQAWMSTLLEVLTSLFHRNNLQESTQKQENIISKALLDDVEISIKWTGGASLNQRSCFSYASMENCINSENISIVGGK